MRLYIGVGGRENIKMALKEINVTEEPNYWCSSMSPYSRIPHISKTADQAATVANSRSSFVEGNLQSSDCLICFSLLLLSFSLLSLSFDIA